MGLMIRPPPGTAGAAWPAIMVGFFVAFGGVLFGETPQRVGNIVDQD